jgi:uncharacterized protein (TIGR02466 family)
MRALLTSGERVQAAKLLNGMIEAAAREKAQGRAEAALAMLEKIVVAVPGHPVVAHDLGVLHAERGEDAAAMDLFRRALKAAPAQREIVRNLAQVLLRSGDLKGAWELSQEVLNIRPGDSFALALAGIVAVERGMADEAAPFIDYRRLVRPFRPSLPSGHDDMGAFNRALAREVLQSDSLRANPDDRTTRQGQQSGGLFPAATNALKALQALISEAVADYTAALPVEAGHPFLGQRPERVRLHGWVTVLDHGGYQEPHLHPSGWLSGVYYPMLPGVSSVAQDGRAGWLCFGEPGPTYCCRTEHPRHWIAPEEGLMVLFPSFMHHRTAPFAGHDRRISIAFDLMPREAGR